MDYRKLAEEAVKAIFDRAEADGRVMHRDTAVDVAENAMRSAMAEADRKPGWDGRVMFLQTEDAVIVEYDDGRSFKLSGLQMRLAQISTPRKD